MENVFSHQGATNLINRIQSVSHDSKPLWGKMRVEQMLAHLNVSYEMVFEPEKYPKPKGFMKYMLLWFVKPKVTDDIPYKKKFANGTSIYYY